MIFSNMEIPPEGIWLNFFQSGFSCLMFLKGEMTMLQSHPSPYPYPEKLCQMNLLSSFILFWGEGGWNRKKNNAKQNFI